MIQIFLVPSHMSISNLREQLCGQITETQTEMLGVMFKCSVMVRGGGQTSCQGPEEDDCGVSVEFP